MGEVRVMVRRCVERRDERLLEGGVGFCSGWR
jgi:hypothetical protein